MAFVSGKFTTCAAPDCDSTSLTTVDESYDQRDRIYVGQQTCDRCGASHLYSRRANTPEEWAMAKKKKPAARRSGKTPHRVNTVRGNGGLPESREVAQPGRRGRPRQQDLPGTEDRAIKPLEDAAQDYAEIRDRRMALNAEEVGLKAKVLRLMKQHGKQAYHRDGVSIEIVVEEETVKVRVKKAGDDEETETSDEVEVEIAGDAETGTDEEGAGA